MIYWKVSACESEKNCLTTDFTRYKYLRKVHNLNFLHEHL